MELDISLSLRERKIIDMALQGHTQVEIAREIGRTQPRVHQILREIGERVREREEEE